MKYYFASNTQRLPMCCGVMEVGQFVTRVTSDENKAKDPSSYQKFRYDTVKEAREAALNEILAINNRFCIQFWFYKPSNYDGEFEEDYIEQEFMDLVKAHPECVQLAEYVNKNSGNMICGLMIDNNTSTDKSEVFN